MNISKSSFMQYAVLFSIFLIGFISYLFIKQDSFSSRLLILGISVSYFLWGIVHHYIEQDLHIKIVVEYILFAALGFIVMSAVTTQL